MIGIVQNLSIESLASHLGGFQSSWFMETSNAYSFPGLYDAQMFRKT